MRTIVLASAAALLLAGAARAQQAQPQQQPPPSDEQLIASAMAAAPRAVSEGAAVVAMDANGAMRTLRQGTNGFTCMPDDPASPGTDPMCLDANAMEWLRAWMEKAEPPEKVGLVFMLVSGSDASNTDPHATEPPPGGRWITTGPHLMVVGGQAVRSMAGYPRTPDPDTSRPYMMWIGSPYEHLMIPVR